MKKNVYMDKSIVKVPNNFVLPNRMRYLTAGSKEYNFRASMNPVAKNGEFIKIYCSEHRCHELVPRGSWAYGYLYIWYAAGVHPRFSIPGVLSAEAVDPIELTRLMRREDGNTWINNAIRKYRNDERAFGKHMALLIRNHQMVDMMAGGQRWTVERMFREQYRNKSFTISQFRRERNQSNRRLMILSRSFDMKDVMKSMQFISADKEGRIYHDPVINQDFLMVTCPTTKERYMLGIPVVRKCSHGFKAPFGSHFGIVRHKPVTSLQKSLAKERNTSDVTCWTFPYKERGWTPSDARRWTFGVEASAKFLAEA